MLIYRKATIDDIDALAKMRFEILKEGSVGYGEDVRDKWESGFKKFFMRAITDGSFVSWVAVDGDRIAATGGASFFSIPPSKSSPTGTVAYLANMYTYHEYRGQGIGTKIIKMAMEEAKSRGCGKIILYATKKAKKLYKKLGFYTDRYDMVYYFR